MYQVLLVDDETLIREAIGEKIQWEELGFHLAGCCKNGKEAKEFVDEKLVDVLMTDICMPYMDGMELSQYVCNQFPDIEILILSGYDDFEYAKKAVKYKVEEYILKPVTAQELTDVLLNLRYKMDKKKEEKAQVTKLKESYQKNLPIIKSRILYSLIQGNQLESEHKRELSENHIMLDAANFRVAGVWIDLYSALGEPDIELQRQSALMSFMVYNITDEIVNRSKAGIAFQGMEGQTYIILQTDRPMEFNKTLPKLCEEIQKEVFAHMKLEVTIGIGRYVYYIKDLALSYGDALECRSYQYLLGGCQVIDMDYIREHKVESMSFDEHLSKLILAVKSNDEKEIHKLFKQVELEFRNGYLQREVVSVYIQRIAVGINEVLKTADLDQNPRFKTIDVFMQDLNKKKQLHDAMEYLQVYCLLAASEMEGEKEGSGKKMALQALDYIEKNYGDPDIGLNSVCSYLSISTSHFSTIFKNYTGGTFLEAVTKKRMEKAKQLLENTNLKNYEIAEKVGYSDPHYFSISFKKVTGKTPKEYAREGR